MSTTRQGVLWTPPRSKPRNAVALLRLLRITKCKVPARFTPAGATYGLAQVLVNAGRIKLVPYGRYRSLLLYRAVLTPEGSR